MNEDEIAVFGAIEEFAAWHRREPFAVLREVGVQAELKRLIDRRLPGGGAEHVEAELVDVHADVAPPVNATATTQRVRLEAKIGLSGNEDDESEVAHDRTDLILYKRERVKLYRHRNGYGDVVHRTDPSSVSVAVEIKASPSNNVAEKRSYARDIARLLRLRRSGHGISGFFVLLDKSRALYRLEADGPWPLRPIAWTGPAGAAKRLGSIVYEQHPQAVRDEDWMDIVVSETPPAAPAGYVEIWDVAADAPQRVRLFAHVSPAPQRADMPLAAAA